MRLIDADVLKNHIKAVIQKQNGKNIDLVPVGELMVFIDNEPTAYDPERVAARLKTDSSVKLYGSGNSNNYLIPISKATEIVRGGGLDG